MLARGVPPVEESYLGPVWASFQAQLPRIAAQGLQRLVRNKLGRKHRGEEGDRG